MKTIHLNIVTATGKPRPLAALPPLSLYIHYPWCVKKCPYCDFNSHEGGNGSDNEREYLTALLSDLEQQLPRVWGRSIHSVFIGGGTPNLLSGAGVDYLLSQVRAYLPLTPDAEITLEANPGADSFDRLRTYAAAGVNRLSIGAQSFNDCHLRALGRIHSSAEATAAIEKALVLFPRVNVDIMYGLPQQTVNEANDDIRHLIKLGVKHISAYQLTLEPNTWFYRHPPAVPDDDQIINMEENIYGLLAAAGCRRYEISAFAAPDNACRHNLNYWQFGDYIGIGAGAHGKISLPGKIYRTRHAKNPRDYRRRLQGTAPAWTETAVSGSDLISEFMLNALRLINGFSLDLFCQRTGLSSLVIRDKLALAQQKKLLTVSKNNIKPTALGLIYLNNLLEIFL